MTASTMPASSSDFRSETPRMPVMPEGTDKKSCFSYSGPKKCLSLRMCRGTAHLYFMLMDNSTHVVIIAGGIGSRLWPASTPETPKQFIDVLGVGKSLIQLTVDRFRPLCDPSRFWVVTSSGYTDLVREQLPEIPEENILAEPEARNTAPCIAYSCWKIASSHPDANIVFTPADALVLNRDVFTGVIKSALEFSASREAVVTVGVMPTRPETGYGYIQVSGTGTGKVTKVISFREKPDLATAKAYLADGNYLWNAGIFVWNARTVVSQFRKYSPGIAAVMDRLAPHLDTPGENAALKELFPQCEKISIDYAVMEKSPDIYVIPAELEWSDLGSWSSVKSHASQDADGNSVVGGDIRLFNCRNSMVHLPAVRKAVIEGLDGYIVAEKGGALLICRLADEQNIKEYSADK